MTVDLDKLEEAAMYWYADTERYFEQSAPNVIIELVAELREARPIVEAARDWALTWFDRHPHDPPKSEASRRLYEAVLGKVTP